MDGTTHRVSPWDGVELLERAIGYTRGSLSHVTPALLGAPTPCSRWDLRMLLVHMNDSLVSLHEAGTRRRVALRRAPCDGIDATLLVDALRERACRLLAEWTADWHRGHADGDVSVDGIALTPRVLTSAGALEVTVHGWDVAVACGVEHPVPESLASDLLRVAPLLVTDSDRPARFAPPLRVTDDAPAAERLLALLGRSVASPLQ